MSEPDDDEGPDIEVYEPMPVGMTDGDCLIFDPVEFAELFNALSVQFRGGDLWALDRDSLEWVKVEPKKGAKPRPLKSV